MGFRPTLVLAISVVMAGLTTGGSASVADLAAPLDHVEGRGPELTESFDSPSTWSPAERALNVRLEALVNEPVVQQAFAEWGRDFYFTRAIYSGYRRWGRGRGSWATDFPKADRQFLFILNRLLTMLDLHEWENPVALADPALRRYPFLYMLEVGNMNLAPEEIEGLRNYLEAGGFLVVDDFWGQDEWDVFEYHMSLVLPDRQIQRIPLDHVIFHQFYDIDEILTVPAINNLGRYKECWGGDPCEPGVYGIFDDRGELMVVINHNSDLGDAWEWSENPYYPIDRSTYAYELAINYIIYGLSH